MLVWQNYREKQAASVAAEKPKPDTRAAVSKDTDDAARSYDFYDRLPNFEVQVPEKTPVANERERNPFL